MTNTLVRNLCIGATAFSVACAQTHGAAGSSQNSADTLKAEIEAVNREMEIAFGRKDLLAVAKFYADDARLIGPRGQEVRGRAAIDAYWVNVRNPKSWRLEAFDIGGSATEAFQFGRSTLVQENAAGDRTSVTDFVVIWKRGLDGMWKIALDFYH
jgi:ketosteroid isomerase-like protein